MQRDLQSQGLQTLRRLCHMTADPSKSMVLGHRPYLPAVTCILNQFPNIVSRDPEIFRFAAKKIKVHNWVNWAFAARGSTQLVESFIGTMRACAAKGDVEIPIGSVCTGWGVAEMVVSELNEKLVELGDGRLPQALAFFDCGYSCPNYS